MSDIHVVFFSFCLLKDKINQLLKVIYKHETIHQLVLIYSKHPFTLFLSPFCLSLCPPLSQLSSSSRDVATTPAASPSSSSIAVDSSPLSLQQRYNRQLEEEDDTEIEALNHWEWPSSAQRHHLCHAQRAPPSSTMLEDATPTSLPSCSFVASMPTSSLSPTTCSCAGMRPSSFSPCSKATPFPQKKLQPLPYSLSHPIA